MEKNTQSGMFPNIDMYPQYWTPGIGDCCMQSKKLIFYAKWKLTVLQLYATIMVQFYETESFHFNENESTDLLECYYEDHPLRFIAIGRPMVGYMLL